MRMRLPRVLADLLLGPADEPEPDEWTPDREDRAVLLSMLGDVDRARTAYQETVRQEYLAYLLATGRIGEGVPG